MTLDHRLDRLMSTLKGRERALLVLRAYKAHEAEDPAWRRSMSVGQYNEFNHLVSLINIANLHLGHLFTLVAGEVDKLELRFFLLMLLQAWQLRLGQASYAASSLVREPVGESEFRTLEAKAATDLLSVRAMAEMLAMKQHAWCEEDLESLPGTGTTVVSDRAWRRVTGEAEAELRRAVDQGELTSRGKAPGLRVARADFEAWWGYGSTLRPGDVDEFDVRPDDSPLLAEDRATFADLMAALSPTTPAWEGASHSLEAMERQLGRDLATSVGLRWQELRMVELALQALEEELGEDPLRPRTRELLDSKRQGLLDLAESLRSLGYKVGLAEPAAADLAELRALVDHWRSL